MSECLSISYSEELTVVMSDNELEDIRRRKLRALQRRLAVKQEKTQEVDADEVLNKIFKDRAWEVFTSASLQYPKIMDRIKDVLAKLALSGKLSEVTGEELYLFLRNLGLRVRLKTNIRVMDHGKLKSFTEKIKEDLQEF
jgi:DNA-binding TFAR19-related protein (PDSD5 family)